ncbi:hypothetical protein Bbelb_186650 [Branchiostoma belcheri]|nr:hypothetical protein Bbelb_186650 [Branchiostoma belcheri]
MCGRKKGRVHKKTVLRKDRTGQCPLTSQLDPVLNEFRVRRQAYHSQSCEQNQEEVGLPTSVQRKGIDHLHLLHRATEEKEMVEEEMRSLFAYLQTENNTSVIEQDIEMNTYLQPNINDTRTSPKFRASRGVERLREHQQSTLRALLDGRDVFLSVRTGGGKSLCYMGFPAAAKALAKAETELGHAPRHPSEVKLSAVNSRAKTGREPEDFSPAKEDVISPATNRLSAYDVNPRKKHMKTVRPENIKAIRPMHMKAIRPKHMETKMVLQKSASPMRKWLSTRHMLMLSLDFSVTCMEEQN